MTNKECKALQHKAHDRVWAHLVGEAGEHIYGGGEQYTYLDLKGRRYPIWVREQGVGRNRHVVDV